jgi:uncharacterized membrane protein
MYLLIVGFATIDSWLGLPVPGLGLLLQIGMLIGAGFLLSNYFAQRAASTIEGFLDRLPLVKLLHKSTKDFMTALMGDKLHPKQEGLVVMAQVWYAAIGSLLPAAQ